jgi:ABC-type antimicrobial peptide transport system permease subunit
MGVRIALGAGAGDVIRLVVGEGVRLSAIGVVVGLAAALYAGRWAQALLYEVSAHDPWTVGGVAVTLLAVAVAASWVPAWRATRVDPNVALRVE